MIWTGSEGQQIRTGAGPTSTGPAASEPPSSTGLGGVSTTTVVSPSSGWRSGATTGVSETTYVMWGGESGSEVDRLDGFAVDLASGDVTEIPAAPMEPAYRTSGVWTGSELIAWTGGYTGMETDTTPASATWHPQDGWRAAAAPPPQIQSGPLASVWAGTRVVAVSSSGEAASYDPATDAWGSVPTVPGLSSMGGAAPGLVWTGTEVVAWAQVAYAGPYPEASGGPIADRGWRWTPGQASWEPLPDLPDAHRTQGASVVWTGDELLVWGQATGGGPLNDDNISVGVGATLRPGAARWQPLPASPQDPGPSYNGTPGSQSIASDPASGRVLVKPLDFSGSGAPTPLLVFDTNTDRWSVTDIALGGYNPTIGLAGSTVLVLDPEAPFAGDIR
jgi:hypothetical protein